MKISALFTLLACISLAACEQNADTPKQIAHKYWQALKSGDTATAKKLVSKNTQASLDNYLALPDEEKIALDEIKLGSEQATVGTTITNNTIASTNQAQSTNNENHVSFDTVLIMEDGQWKIDASQSQAPSPQTPDKPADDGQLSDALQKNLNSIDEVLEEGADMLNEFMHEGSKEMSESLLKGMNKMNNSLREAIEKMKQRREQQQKSPQPVEEKGEGLI
jgi:hypothetical protein